MKPNVTQFPNKTICAQQVKKTNICIVQALILKNSGMNRIMNNIQKYYHEQQP
jgi:hypothetical protein